MPPRPELVLLDVGGVLLVPDGEVVGAAVRAAGVEPARAADPLQAHYRAVAMLDGDDAVPGFGRDLFTRTWLGELGLAVDDPVATAAVHGLLAEPAPGLWRHVTPWAHAGLAALARVDVRLGVVSNADGTVADQLLEHRLAQVGPGRGVVLDVLVDSAVVGVAKPDPAIFAHALEPLGVAADRTWYVGDTVTFDVAGARAAGIHPLHLDPHGWCPRPAGHQHVGDLQQVVELLDEAGRWTS